MRKIASVVTNANNSIIIIFNAGFHLEYLLHPHQEYPNKDNQGKAAYSVQPGPFCSLVIVSWLFDIFFLKPFTNHIINSHI